MRCETTFESTSVTGPFTRTLYVAALRSNAQRTCELPFRIIIIVISIISLIRTNAA